MTENKVVNVSPRINIALSAPDFLVPGPDSVNDKTNDENTIFNWGGVKIVKLSPEVVVKFGPHVTVTEAKSMVFVSHCVHARRSTSSKYSRQGWTHQRYP
jgi:hypothetical protein